MNVQIEDETEDMSCWSLEKYKILSTGYRIAIKQRSIRLSASSKYEDQYSVYFKFTTRKAWKPPSYKSRY